MKVSSISRVIFSLGTLMVALPSSVLGYQPRNTHRGYYDTTAQFVPSAAHQNYQQQKQPQRHGGGRVAAANNWVPRAAPYYQPNSNQHYSNHQDTQATYDQPQEHTPQASHHEQELLADTNSSPSWGGADESSHDGSRVHFHVNGHKGPKSYRFGYDTGKGKARQFRYEERDVHGVVHGRYGYHDKHGKMHVFHYTAHPHHGYQAKEVDPHKYGR